MTNTDTKSLASKNWNPLAGVKLSKPVDVLFAIMIIITPVVLPILLFGGIILGVLWIIALMELAPEGNILRDEG